MVKSGFLLVALCSMYVFCSAQNREELEKQRQDLKKEIEQTEKLLKVNKTETKANLFQWQVINKKVNLQDRVIENINKDLRVLDNNMFTIQKDISKYDKLLDTLKQEYAKSMVYAYKNRSSYDFLNFIFSADNFNDAIKRVTYLKSYRTYREMQGQNILRTQELRKQRIEDLGGAKVKKSSVLQVQSKEMKTLEEQQQEKDRIVADLKKQGKQLNNQIAAKQKQMQKVSNTIAVAIRRAQEEAKRAALAKSAEDERKRKAADKSVVTGNAPVNGTAGNSVPVKSVAGTRSSTKAPVKAPESILLNSENLALNTNFERNRGSLPWPVDKGIVSMHYGPNKMYSGATIVVASTTISSDIGAPVKSVFDGTVIAVTSVEDMQVITIQHGRYFSTYSNLNGVVVQKGQQVKTGTILGKVAANFDGVGALDFYLSNEKSNFDPEGWLRRR